MFLRRAVFIIVLAGIVGACENQGTVEDQVGDSPGAIVDSEIVHADLVEAAVSATPVMRIHVTEAEIQGVFEQVEPRLRIGISKVLGKRIDLRAVNSMSINATGHVAANGAVRAVDSGFVWSGIVESAGAGAMRLEFVDFSLPPGVALYLYNDRGVVRGPYAGAGPHGNGWFWSHTVPGDRVHLQLRYRGAHKSEVLGKTSMAIGEVAHLDPAFVGHGGEPAGSAEAGDLCADNAPCVVNAANAEIPAAIQAARGAVAHYYFKDGRYWYICSGGLIADDDPTTDIPYFLTANHCVSRSRVASTVEAHFNYSTDNGGDCSQLPLGAADVLGATLRTNSSAGDYSLLELSQPAPADTNSLPWTDQPVATSANEPLYRISHPLGNPQAYSEHEVDADGFTCGSLPRGPYIYSVDTSGATEGGSSGSPVLNAQGEIVGQLYGACGTNLQDNCDAVNNRTVDGAINADALRPWLGEPGGGTCTSDTDCDDSNACTGVEICVAGICQGGTPVDCSDGVSCTVDTCDPTDGACSNNADDAACDDGDECTIDSCDAITGCANVEIPGCVSTCGAPGDYCQANAECCSGLCHPKKHYCK